MTPSHYKSRIEKDEVGSANSEKMKRLIQEIGSLSTSLPLYPGMHVTFFSSEFS